MTAAHKGRPRVLEVICTIRAPAHSANMGRVRGKTTRTASAVFPNMGKVQIIESLPARVLLLPGSSWLSKEFQKERKWKQSQCRKFARIVERSKLDVESRREKKEQQNKLAMTIARGPGSPERRPGVDDGYE